MPEPKPENTPDHVIPFRGARGQWLPGASPNPGGRPAVLNEVRDLARKHTAKAVANLAKIANEGKSEMARIAASVALLDRGWGRPTQPIAGDEEMSPINVQEIERERERKGKDALRLIDEIFGADAAHGGGNADG